MVLPCVALEMQYHTPSVCSLSFHNKALWCKIDTLVDSTSGIWYCLATAKSVPHLSFLFLLEKPIGLTHLYMLNLKAWTRGWRMNAYRSSRWDLPLVQLVGAVVGGVSTGLASGCGGKLKQLNRIIFSHGKASDSQLVGAHPSLTMLCVYPCVCVYVCVCMASDSRANLLTITARYDSLRPQRGLLEAYPTVGLLCCNYPALRGAAPVIRQLRTSSPLIADLFLEMLLLWHLQSPHHWCVCVWHLWHYGFAPVPIIYPP